MKLPNRLAATTTCYEPYSLEEALAGIAAAGFHHVELTSIRGLIEHVPLTPDAKTLGRVQRLLNRYALTPVALSAHSNLTNTRGLKDAFRALDLCERMGIPTLNTAVGGPEEGAEDETAFLRNIGGLADYAAEREITITLEIHGELTATGQKSAELMEKVNRPNVRINYDTANCEYFGGVRAEDDLPYAVPWVGLSHLKDKIGGQRVWNFPALGSGHVDFAKLLRMLRRGGYTGPYSVEVEFKGHPWPPVATVNQAMRRSYKYLNGLGLS
jgi:sugar phosphate isomerase/epimerase